MRSKRVFEAFIVALLLAVASGTARAANGGCPSINAIGNFLPSNDGLAASFTIDVSTGNIATYSFTSNNESPTDGVPGLIEYCVYPDALPGSASDITSLATGADGSAFQPVFGAIQGFFSFKRADGNPSNIPFDGSTVTMGMATWGSLTLLNQAPTLQTILLHINDPDECSALYGGSVSTCFVLPATTPPPSSLCNGEPACKQVVVDEADTTSPLTVPAFTLLHLHYTYVIVNQPANTFNMTFTPPAPKTQDINSGGGKDYFGCEQTPDSGSKTPGTWGSYTSYPGLPGWLLNFQQGNGGGCPQSRFFMTANGSPITLTPGQSLTFKVDMVTRVNKGGNQEFTSCGLHFLNSGFTAKWIQSDDGLLHSFTTNPPISVNAVGCQ